MRSIPPPKISGCVSPGLFIRNPADTPPSGVASVSPMMTVLIAPYGIFSSSATTCAVAALADPCPNSASPVRTTNVLSAWISIHEAGCFGSTFILGVAPPAEPTANAVGTLRPTTSAPPPLTNVRRVRVAPKTSMVISSLALISIAPFAITLAAR